MREFGDIPDGICSVVVGDGPAVGEILCKSEKLPLISATGSTRMGRAVGPRGWNTVFLGNQTYQLFFLLAGWAQALPTGYSREPQLSFEHVYS